MVTYCLTIRSNIITLIGATLCDRDFTTKSCFASFILDFVEVVLENLAERIARILMVFSGLFLLFSLLGFLLETLFGSGRVSIDD